MALWAYEDEYGDITDAEADIFFKASIDTIKEVA